MENILTYVIGGCGILLFAIMFISKIIQARNGRADWGEMFIPVCGIAIMFTLMANQMTVAQEKDELLSKGHTLNNVSVYAHCRAFIFGNSKAQCTIQLAQLVKAENVLNE